MALLATVVARARRHRDGARGRARAGRDPGDARAARPWPGGWARRRSRRCSSVGGRTAWARRATPSCASRASCRAAATRTPSGPAGASWRAAACAPRRCPAGRFRAAVFGDHGTGGDGAARRGAAGGELAPRRAGRAGRPGLPADPRPAAGAELLPPAAPAAAPRRPRAGARQPRAGRCSGGRTFLGALELRGAERWYLERYGSAALLVLDSNTSLAPGSAAGPLPRAGRGGRRAAPASASRCCTTRPTRRPSDTLAAGLRATCCPCCGATASSCCCSGTCTPTSARVPVDGMTHVAVGTGRRRDRPRRAGRPPRWRRAPTAASARCGWTSARAWRPGAFVTVDGVVRDRFSARCRPSRQCFGLRRTGANPRGEPVPPSSAFRSSSADDGP